MQLAKRDGETVLKAEVAGIEPGEVKVEIKDGVLTVSGEHEESSEEERDGFVHRERRYASFSRTMPAPEGVTADQVETSAKDGVVEVKIPAGSAEES